MSGITNAITDAVGSGGVYAVFGLMLLDAVFPAGSEIIMLYAGALVAGAFPEHGVSLFGEDIESTPWGYVVMVAAGSLGYWLGSLGGWWIGVAGGRPLLERYGRIFHLDEAKLDRAHGWFERHGYAAVFITRNLPVVRSFISIPAGVAEMRFTPYALLTLAGTLPWNLGFVGAGLALGEGWERVHDGFRYADYIVVGVIVAAAGYLVWRYARRRSARATAAEAAESPPSPVE
jgi:membrane protein DedA with SNARE-associated domain